MARGQSSIQTNANALLFGTRKSKAIGDFSKANDLLDLYKVHKFPMPRGGNNKDWRAKLKVGDFIEIKITKELVDDFENQFVVRKSELEETRLKNIKILFEAGIEWMTVQALEAPQGDAQGINMMTPLLGVYDTVFYPDEINQ